MTLPRLPVPVAFLPSSPIIGTIRSLTRRGTHVNRLPIPDTVAGGRLAHALRRRPGPAAAAVGGRRPHDTAAGLPGHVVCRRAGPGPAHRLQLRRPRPALGRGVLLLPEVADNG